MGLIGLDIGEKRIGVAASDPLGKTAQPLETIPRDDAAIDHLSDLARRRGARLLVVGLPLLMDGSEGAQARDVRAYAGRLAFRLGLPVEFVDERLTTRQAESFLSRTGAPRGVRRAASDRVAAALILGSYMEQHPEE